MSLVGKVGRRRPRARFAMGVVYLFLCLGAITTLYPFLLMVSTGLKGPTDQNDNKLLPSYFSDQKTLLAKYLNDKFAGNDTDIAANAVGQSTTNGDLEKYKKYLQNLPIDYWQAGFGMSPNQVSSRLRTRYQQWLAAKYGNIEAVNKAYVEEALAFQTIDVPSELLPRKTWLPPRNRKYQEWREFKATLPIEYRIPIRTDRIFQVWAAAKWKNRIADVPAHVKGTAEKFEQLSLPLSGAIRDEFLKTALPDRYSEGAAERFWTSGTMPIAAFDQAFVAENASETKSEFATRNYRFVLDYMMLNGGAVVNTVTFCFLAILTQLIVNPLAAYALSRYPIRSSGKILIFLLATMAFPAEVTMIPSFLLLKNLGLLNTYAALILPSAASGYMIFLLKGFFDSLPSELFEAGQLDGAPESTMMLKIALPLSRPVLGYLALLAFMGAYGTFIYAFLVVQDSRKWTIMVWVYQLQQIAPKAVTMAALTLAALPTLIVFLCAQNVIMRGIVLPGER